MTVNYLASEGQGTETRVSVSLQLHSDSRLNTEVVPSPMSSTLGGSPSCAWGGLEGTEEP